MTGTGFPPVNFTLPVLHYTKKRPKLIILITGLHNKPQGCGASVASAAGPFTKNTIKLVQHLSFSQKIRKIKLLPVHT